MAQKSNIRSIRMTDEMAELIDRQDGGNFTEKWERLVTRCVWELPEKEAQLKTVQAKIEEEKQRLYNLQRATEQLRSLEQDIQNAQYSAQYYFKLIERGARQIAETAEKEA